MTRFTYAQENANNCLAGARVKATMDTSHPDFEDAEMQVWVGYIFESLKYEIYLNMPILN